jgi:pimeloyl-ACP methyl ester carboxylesterase
VPFAFAGGVQLYYETHGSGPSLVLLHGGWSDSSTFAENIPALSQRYQVIAYDRRGCGRSSKVEPSAHSVELWLDDLKGVLRYMGIEQAHLCGVSYGALQVLECAFRMPELVRSAVLISGTAEGYVASREPVVPFPRRLEDLPSLRLPVLIIHGENDTAFPPRMAEEMHRGIAGSELHIIPEAGHGVHRERPELVNALVMAFLERVEGLSVP